MSTRTRPTIPVPLPAMPTAPLRERDECAPVPVEDTMLTPPRTEARGRRREAVPMTTRGSK